jgi:hypothetical protein
MVSKLNKSITATKIEIEENKEIKHLKAKLMAENVG